MLPLALSSGCSNAGAGKDGEVEGVGGVISRFESSFLPRGVSDGGRQA